MLCPCYCVLLMSIMLFSVSCVSALFVFSVLRAVLLLWRVDVYALFIYMFSVLKVFKYLLHFVSCVIVTSQGFKVFHCFLQLLLFCGDVYVVLHVRVLVFTVYVLRHNCYRVLMFAHFSMS